MELRETFDRLGLPKHSSEIYTALESDGPLTVLAISREIKCHRPAIYRALSAMKKIGIVSESDEGKHTRYAAESRHKIVQIFRNVTKEVAALEKNTEHPVGRSFGALRYFEGKGAVAEIFNDAINHSSRGETFFRYTSEKDLDQVNALLPVDYRKRRDAKRLERLVISNPESGKRKRNRLERFIKFLGSERESFHQNAIQLIYGSRIAFIDLNTFKAFIIDNSTLAEFQKTIFRALYKRL